MARALRILALWECNAGVWKPLSGLKGRQEEKTNVACATRRESYVGTCRLGGQNTMSHALPEGILNRAYICIASLNIHYEA